MAYKKSVYTQSRRYSSVKQRVCFMKGRAQRIGLAYLLATLALTAFSVFSLVNVSLPEGARPLGVFSVVSDFALLTSGSVSEEWMVAFGIYGALLFILSVNIIRSFIKLGWLFKRMASRIYGVNRNMYAMEDLGKIFSDSFSSVIVFHAAIFLLFDVAVGVFTWIALAVALFFHFLCGSLSGNVSFFGMENGELTEEKREVGNVSPFVRSLLQLGFVAALLFMLVKTDVVYQAVRVFYSVGDANVAKAAYGVVWQEMLVAAWAAIIPLLCLFVVLLAFAMVRYATGRREFDISGTETPARKRFLLCSILLTLVVAGIFTVWQCLQTEAAISDAFALDLAIVGGLALGAVVAELCTLNYPKGKAEDVEDGYDYVFEGGFTR